MNREILFRGQKSSTKEWIEGSLIINKAGDHVITQVIENPVHLGTLNGWCFAVIPETIGQYTELEDRGGIKFFEGDVIGRIGFLHRIIVYHKNGFYTYSINNPERLFPLSLDEYDFVIGNLHDNPELLKGE